MNNDLKRMLDAYLKLGWPVLPLRGKAPYHCDWPNRNFTPEEVLTELEAGRADGLGVKTGKPSHTLALDIDQPHLVGFDPKPAIEKGALAHTTSRGRIRLVFRVADELYGLSKKVVVWKNELSEEEQKLLVGVEDKEFITVAEILGDGRQFVAPPSRHPETGEVYSWLIPLPDDPSKILLVKSVKELRRLLSFCFAKRWIVAALLPPEVKVRKDPAALSKVLAVLEPYKDREYSSWITYHCPFHPPDLKASFALSKESGLAIDFHDDTYYTPQKLAKRLGIPLEDKNNKSMAAKCVELATKFGTLFHDPLGDGYIRIKTSDAYSTLKLRSRRFKQLLAYKLYKEESRVPTAEDISQAVATLEAKAVFEGERRELAVRVKREGDTIFYDPCREDWKLIRITRDGCAVVDNLEPRFRRYSHMQAQAEVQAAEPKDSLALLKFINLPRSAQGLSDEEVLIIVTMLSYLIPDIPHPILILYGHQGSGKTLAFKIIRSLIDPSAIAVLSMPDDVREFVQQLAHNNVAFYDNVSSLSEWQADTLCRAVTGEGFTKRELYTDEEDIVFAFKRCVGINAVNIPTARPDLLDRSILIEVPPIAANQRRTEEELLKEFEAEKPKILGGFFAALSEAIALRPTVKLASKPRLADFAEWGYALAEAVGIGGPRFIEAYERNVSRQAEEIVRSSAVAEALVKLMEGRDKWEGSPTQLLEELERIAAQLKISVVAKGWPKAPHTLSRRLRELRNPLLCFNLQLESGRDKERRWIKITKVASSASPASPKVGEKKADKDDATPDATKVQTAKSVSKDEAKTDDASDAPDAISAALPRSVRGFPVEVYLWHSFQLPSLLQKSFDGRRSWFKPNQAPPTCGECLHHQDARCLKRPEWVAVMPTATHAQTCEYFARKDGG